MGRKDVIENVCMNCSHAVESGSHLQPTLVCNNRDSPWFAMTTPFHAWCEKFEQKSKDTDHD